MQVDHGRRDLATTQRVLEPIEHFIAFVARVAAVQVEVEAQFGDLAGAEKCGCVAD